MKTPTLAVYLFGFNLNQIKYPWVASIRSALDLADAVYFCECYSDDTTWADTQTLFRDEIRDGKLVVSRHEWGKHHSIQAIIGNYLLEQIGDEYDFALKMDADEVLAEWSFEAFAQDLRAMKGSGIGLGRPQYTHLCPDDRHTFAFIYDRKAVISRTSLGLRFEVREGGDACALGGASEVNTRLRVFHYGKMGMGREREAIKKEYDFQQLYTSLGFPDPLVVEQYQNQGYADYERIFHVAKSAGQFWRYDGPHPKYVTPWLDEMRMRHKEFLNGLAALGTASLNLDSENG